MSLDKIRRRSGNDRRKNPDRRNGEDRRMNGSNNSNGNDVIFDTKEACWYLKITRPTFYKYIASGRIKAQKIGRGWKVFKSELDRFMRDG